MLYKPMLRPASVHTLPAGVKWDYVELPRDFAGNRPDLERGDTRYGIIQLDRALTPDEREHFDLVLA